MVFNSWQHKLKCFFIGSPSLGRIGILQGANAKTLWNELFKDDTRVF